MKPLSILLVMTARTVGGAELYVERLIAALGDACRFTVVLADHAEMSKLAERLAQRCQVLAFPFDGFAALPGAALRLRKMAADFDVIHLNSNHPGSRLGILMGFALGASGRPVVCVEQGVSPISAIRVPAGIAWALPTLFRWSRRSATRVVAVSEENRRRLIELYRVPAEKITTIYNGFDPQWLADDTPGDLRKELGLASDQPIILVVGRLAANKGQRYLIEAAPAILDRFPDAHFVFAGNPEGRADLDQRINALGLERHFSLIGFRSDVVNLLKSSDLFVLPSLAEGFSLSLIEAMAAGLPVVATRVGGAAEALEDGRNGFLVPTGDVGALERAVITALSLDASSREGLCRAARQTAQRFSFDTTASRMLELYSDLTRRSP